MKISGVAHCEWTEGSGDKKQTFTGNETYLNERMYLAGGPEGFAMDDLTSEPFRHGWKSISISGEIHIAAGRHTYYFSCNLSPSLPSSLQARYGYIRYTVTVVLGSQEYKEWFTVVKPFNLNLNPSLRVRMGKDHHVLTLLAPSLTICFLFIASRYQRWWTNILSMLFPRLLPNGANAYYGEDSSEWIHSGSNHQCSYPCGQQGRDQCWIECETV